MTTVVRRNDDLSRYEITVDDQLAGFVTFRVDDDVITFVHTETEPEFRGQGVASTLVTEALDDVRGRGERVIARCAFVRGYIEEHPEYQDLLAAE
jgi:predicted GNAT family acetyltransferase